MEHTSLLCTGHLRLEYRYSLKITQLFYQEDPELCLLLLVLFPQTKLANAFSLLLSLQQKD